MDGTRGLAFPDYTLVNETETGDKSVITIVRGGERDNEMRSSHVWSLRQKHGSHSKTHKTCREAIWGLMDESRKVFQFGL